MYFVRVLCGSFHVRLLHDMSLRFVKASAVQRQAGSFYCFRRRCEARTRDVIGRHDLIRAKKQAARTVCCAVAQSETSGAASPKPHDEAGGTDAPASQCHVDPQWLLLPYIPSIAICVARITLFLANAIEHLGLSVLPFISMCFLGAAQEEAAAHDVVTAALHWASQHVTTLVQVGMKVEELTAVPLMLVEAFPLMGLVRVLGTILCSRYAAETFSPWSRREPLRRACLQGVLLLHCSLLTRSSIPMLSGTPLELYVVSAWITFLTLDMAVALALQAVGVGWFVRKTTDESTTMVGLYFLLGCRAVVDCAIRLALRHHAVEAGAGQLLLLLSCISPLILGLLTMAVSDVHVPDNTAKLLLFPSLCFCTAFLQ